MIALDRQSATPRRTGGMRAGMTIAGPKADSVPAAIAAAQAAGSLNLMLDSRGELPDLGERCALVQPTFRSRPALLPTGQSSAVGCPAPRRLVGFGASGRATSEPRLVGRARWFAGQA